MTRLTNRLFTPERMAREHPFGLPPFGRRSHRFRFAGRCDLFNQRGEYLGSADLSSEEITAISRGLDSDDVLIVLAEQSFPDGIAQERPPGFRRSYRRIVGECTHLVTRNQPYLVDDDVAARQTWASLYGVLCRVTTQSGARQLIANYRRLPVVSEF